MLLNKKTALMVIPLSVILLTGCIQSRDISVIEQDVLDYNNTVDATLKAFASSVSKSDELKGQLIKELTTDTGIALNDKYKLKRLTEEDKRIFEYPMVTFNEKFTSYGSVGMREVIILTGSQSKQMTIILSWSNNELVGIERYK